MFAIVFSLQDRASMNMFERFLEKGFKETSIEWQRMPIYKKGEVILVRIREDIIFANNSLDELGAEHLIFASRHKAESGIATLTVHHTGVFGEADERYGGRSRELCFTEPDVTRRIYLEMLNNYPEGYRVSLEVTHHGPTSIKTPLTFVELGSTMEQWLDKEAADFLVSCILKGLKRNDKAEHVIGIGGNHYASVFSELEKEKAFGHICPKYSQDFLDRRNLEQMFKKSTAKKAFIDSKGTKKKADVKRMIEALGYDYELI
ncbi:hypothetical protein DRN74_01190 [Candidatus Micrarchaeota archaeon]|nr:MAG: hypothetical protein DRN74_01190 [Candidatus Micrarchaeota archaeon]